VLDGWRIPRQAEIEDGKRERDDGEVEDR